MYLYFDWNLARYLENPKNSLTIQTFPRNHLSDQPIKRRAHTSIPTADSLTNFCRSAKFAKTRRDNKAENSRPGNSPALKEKKGEKERLLLENKDETKRKKAAARRFANKDNNSLLSLWARARAANQLYWHWEQQQPERLRINSRANSTRQA